MTQSNLAYKIEDCVILEGSIVNPHEKPFHGQVVMDPLSGKVVDVIDASKRQLHVNDNVKKYTGSSEYIFPGFINSHSHMREFRHHKTGEIVLPDNEDYHHAILSMINGGLTHAAAMPNLPNPIIDAKEKAYHVQRFREIADEMGVPVDPEFYIGIMTGSVPLMTPEVYKTYLAHSVGGVFHNNIEDFLSTIVNYEGQRVNMHVESNERLEFLEKALCDDHDHADRRDVLTVMDALHPALWAIHEYNLKAKICHLSTSGDALDAIKLHRDLGDHIDLEVSPMHLLFDADMIREDNWALAPYLQMNPAPQGREHLVGLRGAFLERILNMNGDDSASHTLPVKFHQFDKEDYRKAYPNLNPEEIFYQMMQDDPEHCALLCRKNAMSGAPWMDITVPMATWVYQKLSMNLGDIAAFYSGNPGEYFNEVEEARGESTKRGKLEKGYLANVTVIDFDKEFTFTRGHVQSKCGWSPVEGLKFPGQTVDVYIKAQRMDRPEVRDVPKSPLHLLRDQGKGIPYEFY